MLVNSFDTSFSQGSGHFAYQAIAGVRKSITENIDLGLKYRFFDATRIHFDDSSTRFTTRFRSSSLLLSLIYNFAPPPPPPPPPTQTCPDGSVILATDVCPAPPPPPPPPPPEPVRG